MILKNILGLVLCSATATFVMAEDVEKLQKQIEIETVKQARSVHLGYALPPSSIAYGEARVVYGAPGSYFCIMGFNVGYLGIQELHNSEKVGIFSVWEPGNPHDATAHPDLVKSDEQAQVLFVGENVNVTRFGGEGTGGKSMFKYDWKFGETVSVALESHVMTNGWSAYTGWIYNSPEKKWKRIATFATLAANGKSKLSGLHSFVEDFRRNYASKGWVRKADFRGFAVYNDGKWIETPSANFTGDRNKSMNIDAGFEKGWYFLQTGGMTENINTPLWKKIEKTTEIDAETQQRRAALLKTIEASK